MKSIEIFHQITRTFSLSDVDECSTDEDLCHVNGSCYNTDGSYECECLPGFIGDGFNCSSKTINSINKDPQECCTKLYIILIFLSYFSPDIDDCADSKNNNCSANANCTDNVGSYDCTCSAGYAGDGFSCDGKFELG